jgi:hypothetical protein
LQVTIPPTIDPKVLEVVECVLASKCRIVSAVRAEFICFTDTKSEGAFCRNARRHAHHARHAHRSHARRRPARRHARRCHAHAAALGEDSESLPLINDQIAVLFAARAALL